MLEAAPPPEADEHRWPADDNEAGAGPNEVLLLEGVLRPHGSHAAGDHDRLVISTRLCALVADRDLGEQGSEIASGAGTAEFVVERSAANGSLEHNVQAAGYMRRLSHIWELPRLLESWYEQIGHCEPC